MKCPNCQTENRENSRFCNQCATSLIVAADKPHEAVTDKPSKDAADESPEVPEDQSAEVEKIETPDTSQVEFSEATRTIELATRGLEKGAIIAEKYRIVEKLGEGGWALFTKPWT